MKDSIGIFLLMSLLQLIAFEWASAIWLWGQSNSKKRLNYNLGASINHNYEHFAAVLLIQFQLSFSFSKRRRSDEDNDNNKKRLTRGCHSSRKKSVGRDDTFGHRSMIWWAGETDNNHHRKWYFSDTQA